MDSFDDVIKRRALPGILIFSRKCELVFLSAEASGLIQLCSESSEGPKPVPQEICTLCEKVNKLSENPRKEKESVHTNIRCHGEVYSARAVPLFKSSRSKKPSHIMVVLEKLSGRRSVNLEKVKTKFNLTQRESEVSGELAKGFTNQEIASALSISEHTVKDHVKKIMDKFGVNSRASVIFKIFE